MGEQFSPHGLDIDFDKNIILTSDFVVPITILKPTLGIQRANTLRLWSLNNRKIINTITLPNVSSRLMETGGISLLTSLRVAVSKMSSSSLATRRVLLSRRE